MTERAHDSVATPSREGATSHARDAESCISQYDLDMHRIGNEADSRAPDSPPRGCPPAGKQSFPKRPAYGVRSKATNLLAKGVSVEAKRPLTRGAKRRSNTAPRRKALHQQGMTLIEIMIVVLIMAIAATGMSYSFGALNRTQLRSACMSITAASRFAYNRAITRGMTVRIAFDFENDTMAIEEAHGRITLARTTDQRRLDIEEDDENANSDSAAVDPWAAAQARLADTLHPSFGASPFQPIAGARYAARPIAPGISIQRLITPHEAEPRVRGTGHIYFFPHGQTERAVVWVSDSDDGENVFSVEIHPLSGRARVRNTAYEPEELVLDGEEEGEVSAR